MNCLNMSLLAIGLSFGLIACQVPTSKAKGESHHYTVKQKCPALLVMESGETLEFNAPENPTTGYRWQIMQPLKLFKTEELYVATEVEEGVMGSGGEKKIKFTAEKPGQELIQLAYVRPWEVDQNISKPNANQTWQCRIRIS